MPEPFFIHEGEIVIWTQEQNLYCQFRILEGDTKECARLLLRALDLLDQYGLEREYTILIERVPFVYDSKSPVILPEEK